MPIVNAGGSLHSRLRSFKREAARRRRPARTRCQHTPRRG